MAVIPLPSNPLYQRWLQVGGSLTAQLRRHGEVRIVVLREGAQALGLDERLDLGIRCGYVREVVILVNGVPAVWARSATSLAAIQGAWRALVNLGNRPLAELLFEDSAIARSPLQPHHLVRHGPDTQQVRQAWTRLLQAPMPAFVPTWARSSVFLHHGQRLRVYEAFAPWILQKPLGFKPRLRSVHSGR